MKSPSLERQQLALSFVSAMFPLGAESVQRSFLGSWLWHIPARLGVNTALDYATLSVALAYFARMSGAAAAPDLLHRAQLAYASALRYLATAVGSCSTWASTDVLCATMLLGHYEVSQHHTHIHIVFLDKECPSHLQEPAFSWSFSLLSMSTPHGFTMLAGRHVFCNCEGPVDATSLRLTTLYSWRAVDQL